MEKLKSLQLLAIVSLSTLLVVTVKGQIRAPCTISMIAGFTPCINYITGSSNNGTVPSSGCCDAFTSLTTISRDCACLIVTANVPVQLPLNPLSAISLPQACGVSASSLNCKATGTPLPAPGPMLLVPPPPPAAAAPLSPKPALPPTDAAPSSPKPALPPKDAAPLSPKPAVVSIAASPLSPRASKAASMASSAPESDPSLSLAPAFPPVEVEAEAPTSGGIRPVEIPAAFNSASKISHISQLSSLLLLLIVTVMLFKTF